MNDSPADRLAATALSGANADFLETLYRRFLDDPKSVDASWARYFTQLKANGAMPAAMAPREAPRTAAQAAQAAQAAGPRASAAGGAAPDTGAASAKQAAVSRLIQVYANRG